MRYHEGSDFGTIGVRQGLRGSSGLRIDYVFVGTAERLDFHGLLVFRP